MLNTHENREKFVTDLPNKSFFWESILRVSYYDTVFMAPDKKEVLAI